MHLNLLPLWLLLFDAPLAWVNPARCLPVCDYDPGTRLIRVNDRAEPDPRGRQRLSAEALGPLQELFAAARQDGAVFLLRSPFRSYGDQAYVFRKYKEKGRAARQGHSEHQLGTAADLVLRNAAAVSWLAKHAHLYGFVLSYPPGKQRVTGYRPEPWHIRYVGVTLAAELHRRGITLEEWFRANPQKGASGDCHDCPLAESRAPACGATTESGGCRGNVLTWCYDGVLTQVDCAASGDRCALSPATGRSDCVAR